MRIFEEESKGFIEAAVFLKKLLLPLLFSSFFYQGEVQALELSCVLVLNPHKQFYFYEGDPALLENVMPFPVENMEYTGVFAGPGPSEPFFAQLRQDHETVETQRLSIEPYRQKHSQGQHNPEMDAKILARLSSSESRSFYYSDSFVDALGNWRPSVLFSKLAIHSYVNYYVYGSTLAIRHKVTGEMIGMIGWEVDPQAQEVNLYYIIWKEHRGQKYAQEALAGLSSHLVKSDKVISVEILKSNVASIAVAKAAGYQIVEDNEEFVKMLYLGKK